VKKLWLLLPALLLPLAVITLFSCPSDPPSPVIITDPDFTIYGSNYEVEIPVDGDDGFRITEGEQYRVTFNVLDADSDFYGSRVGGKLVYKDEEEDTDKILAGWKWLSPPFIRGPGIYRWTFTAGDKGTDGEGGTIVSPATTPEGMKQYFRLNIQDANYDQYPDYFEFNIKGGFTVIHYTPPTGTLTFTEVIEMDFSGTTHDASIGKGNIAGAAFDKVKAASNGAVLRFYIVNVTVSALAGQEGHGVGAVGNKENVDGDNVNYPFNIPRGTPAGTGVSFTVDVPVEDALTFVGPNESHLFVNMWGGDNPAKCDKVELWEYK